VQETGNLNERCGSVEVEVTDGGEGDERAVAEGGHKGEHVLVGVVGLVHFEAVQLSELLEIIEFQAVDPLRGHGGQLTSVGCEVSAVR
jgi:hypothetical protein